MDSSENFLPVDNMTAEVASTSPNNYFANSEFARTSQACPSTTGSSSPLSAVPTELFTPDLLPADYDHMNEELLLLGGEGSPYPNISNMDMSDGSDEFLLEPTMIKRKRSVSLEPTESSDVQHTQAMEEHDSFRHDHANPSSKGDSMEMDKPIAQGPISSADLVDQPTPDNVPLGIATSQTEDKSDNRTDVEFFAQEDLDDRVERSALTKNAKGQWVMPRGCTQCIETRQFCSRGTPCRRCTNKEIFCSRPSGEQISRSKKQRSGQVSPPKKRVRIDPVAAVQDTPVKDEPGIHAEDEIVAGSSSSASVPVVLAPKRRTLPRSVVKSSVPKVKVEKSEKSVKPAALSPDQQNSVKPPCIGQPPVWAETRQALCETLPYYRAHQSGSYSHHRIVYGSLLDGIASPRDYMDGRVVVGHCGGSSTTDENGVRVLGRDQSTEDSICKALMENIKHKTPVTLLLGTGCAVSPGKVPHRYCVMDHFKVTLNWQEKCPLNGRIRQKFRYEKLDCEKTGWWDIADTPNTPEIMAYQLCEGCNTSSPQVYGHGWTCLNSDCQTHFWKEFDNYTGEYRYAASFLNARTFWECSVPPYQLNPPLPACATSSEPDYYTHANFRGICCPRCNRCNTRVMWTGWKCETEGCGFELMRELVTLKAHRFVKPNGLVFTGPAIPTNVVSDSKIVENRFVKNGMTVVQYFLPDCDGYVTHMLSNSLINAGLGGANWMLEEYQSLDQPFTRKQLQTASGMTYTRQFTYNSGQPYKYVAQHKTEFNWNEAPAVAYHAKKFLQERVSLVHPNAAEFNEILSVGYFEKGKMGYHDDGEVGLGPTVASVSLGAPASMKFRLKSKTIKVINALGNEVSKKQNSKVALELNLRHGDIMIMHGAAIQKYYEHEVINEGLFRVAATARFIADENFTTIHRFNRIKGEASRPLAPAESVLQDRVATVNPPQFNGLDHSAEPSLEEGLYRVPVDAHFPMTETGDLTKVSAVDSGDPTVLLANSLQLTVPAAVVQNGQPSTTQTTVTNCGEDVDDYDSLMDMSGNPW